MHQLVKTAVTQALDREDRPVNGEGIQEDDGQHEAGEAAGEDAERHGQMIGEATTGSGR